MSGSFPTVSIAGVRLEYQWTTPPEASPAKPAIVLLHEGLGSVSMWRDFPRSLASRTGCAILAYARRGHGGSDRLAAARDPSYMHVEGEQVLPQLLGALGVEKPILFGHSDGASIALLYAAANPTGSRGLILEAPHVFVEDLTLASIAAVRDSYGSQDLARRLARHHHDPDHTFRGWNDIWLDPRFRDWNIEQGLERIAAPVLLIQGKDDEYGSVAQLDAIAARVPAAEILLLDDCGHAPHRDQSDAVLGASAKFVERVSPR